MVLWAFQSVRRFYYADRVCCRHIEMMPCPSVPGAAHMAVAEPYSSGRCASLAAYDTDAIFMARQMQENFRVKGKKLYFGFVMKVNA